MNLNQSCRFDLSLVTGKDPTKLDNHFLLILETFFIE